MGDPHAADFVFGQSLPTYLVPLDVTTQCQLTGDELASMQGQGRFGTFLASITKFYLDYHRRVMGMDAVYLHDPTAYLAVIQAELFTWQPVRLRVLTAGIALGMTIADLGHKKWHYPNEWSERPQVQVALGINAARIKASLLERMLQ